MSKNKRDTTTYNHEYRQKNKEALRVAGAEYYQKNKEKIRAAGAEYYQKNKEKINATAVEYYKKNKEKIDKAGAKYRQENKEKINATGAEYRQKNKAKINAAWSANACLRKYGITLEEKVQLLKSQDGMCAICLRKTPTKKGWIIDHNHITNVVRGILCLKCNTALGLLNEDRDTVLRVVEYLDKHNK